MTVRQILRQVPEGGIVEIWLGGWGGASHFGTWQVSKRTLIGPLEWTQPITWGEARKQYRQENRHAMPPIVRVRRVQ